MSKKECKLDDADLSAYYRIVVNANKQETPIGKSIVESYNDFRSWVKIRDKTKLVFYIAVLPFTQKSVENFISKLDGGKNYISFAKEVMSMSLFND